MSYYKPGGHNDAIAAFLNRFIPGSQKSLKKLEINVDTDNFPAAILKVLEEASGSLESLFIKSIGSSRSGPSELMQTLLSVFDCCKFKDSLKYLTLHMDITDSLIDTISRVFPNLLEICIPNARFPGDETTSIRKWNTFAEGLPNLKLLGIHFSDPIFNIFGRYIDSRDPLVRIAAWKSAIAEINRVVPIRLRNILIADLHHNSFSTQAFGYSRSCEGDFYTSQAMDVIVGAGWPIQIAGRCSLLCEALEAAQDGLIHRDAINRVIKSILQNPERVDLLATGHKTGLNPAQLALLTGNASLLDSILSLSNNVPNGDIQLLISSQGRVNMFICALQFCSRKSIVPAFKLMLSRQSELGLYDSLCHQEIADSKNVNVVEKLILNHWHEPLLLLLEKGAQIYSPLPRACSFQPSVLHLALHNISPADMVAEFFVATSSFFTNRDDLITTENLDKPFNDTGFSLLASMVRVPKCSILPKALAVASEKQKQLALLEITKDLRHFCESNERMLFNTTANSPQAFLAAIQAGVGSRVLLMIEVYGIDNATKADSNGLFPVNHFAEAVLNRWDEMRKDFRTASTKALSALFQPQAVQRSKSALLNLQMSLKTFADRLKSSPGAAMKKMAKEALALQENVNQKLKTAK